MDSSTYFTVSGDDVHESFTSQLPEAGSFTEDCSPVVPKSTPLAFPVSEDLPAEECNILKGFNQIIAGNAQHIGSFDLQRRELEERGVLRAEPL